MFQVKILSLTAKCVVLSRNGNGSPSHWGFDRLHDHRVPCAVCHATGRPSTFMLPANIHVLLGGPGNTMAT